MEYLSIALISSLFLGAYLGVPSSTSFFLFRFLLPVHFVLVILIDREYVKKIVKNNQWLFCFLFSWVGMNILSLFWTESFGLSVRYIYYALEVCYLFFVGGYCSYKNFFKKIQIVLTVIFVISLCIGVIEILTGWHLPQSGSLVYMTTTSKHQPTGFLYNTNDFAMYITIYFPLIFYFLVYQVKQKWSNYFAFGLWLISIFVVVSTYSRTGIVLIAVISLWVLYQLRKYVPLFLISGTTVLLLTNLGQKKLLGIIFRSFREKGASTTERMGLYSNTIQIFKSSHGLGVGAGGVPMKLNNLRLGYESLNNQIASAHNFLLETAGEIGFFSISLFLFLGYLVYQYGTYVFQNSELKNKLYLSVSTLMFMAFFLSSVALSTIVEQRGLWFALSLAYFHAQKVKTKKKESNHVDMDTTCRF